MTKFLANTGLLIASFAISLAQYWYTFGLWPKSWTSFVLCATGTIMVLGLREVVERESK